MNYIFTNGCLVDPSTERFQNVSLLTEAGRISQIGSMEECRLKSKEAYEVIDLRGKMLLPAFTDTHTHFVEHAKSNILLNLLSCNSIEDIWRNLANYRDQLSWNAKWILGGGWDRNKLHNPNELNRYVLDKIFPDIPVALMSKDYHSRLCNSLALQIAGIDSTTKDPYGGKVERFSSGKPSGVLFETASEIMDKYIVPADDAQIVQAIRGSVSQIYKLGLVGFHTMESANSRNLLLAALSQGQRFRLVWHFPIDELDNVSREGIKSYEADELYTIGGMKIFGDGSLGSMTAAMFQAYPSDKENFGILRYSNDELLSLMTAAATKGYSCSIHAIGNRCVRQVIDTTLKLRSDSQYAKLFQRIEHLQSIRNQDIPALKESALFASVQPVHLANDVPLIDKHWNSIEDQVYSFSTLLKAGIPLSFGSDTPIETINPFLGIYTAIERRMQLNPALPPFRSSEVLTPFQALHGYTLGAAAASRSEHLQGSLTLGKRADLIVIDDFRNHDSSFWLNAQSWLTMINGEIVYSNL
ncbi:MAG: amidohydrolase [Candidatus Cloacimonetes bacterium]|nr:amidohydrolase [Candidatus Cloacimonadota bacterium]